MRVRGGVSAAPVPTGYLVAGSGPAGVAATVAVARTLSAEFTGRRPGPRIRPII